jgi:hypothetical protein
MRRKAGERRSVRVLARIAGPGRRAGALQASGERAQSRERARLNERIRALQLGVSHPLHLEQLEALDKYI